MSPLSFKRHCFPPEIIRRKVWLYTRFTMSYRDIAEILASEKASYLSGQLIILDGGNTLQEHKLAFERGC